MNELEPTENPCKEIPLGIGGLRASRDLHQKYKVLMDDCTCPFCHTIARIIHESIEIGHTNDGYRIRCNSNECTMKPITRTHPRIEGALFDWCSQKYTPLQVMTLIEVGKL